MSGVVAAAGPVLAGRVLAHGGHAHWGWVAFAALVPLFVLVVLVVLTEKRR